MKGVLKMNQLIDSITSISGVSIMVISGIISLITIAILIIDLLYRGYGKLSVISKLLMMITMFLMTSFILISAMQILTHENNIEGKVVKYHYNERQSHMTLKHHHQMKRYTVTGIANQFRYQKGDTIHAQETDNLIYNVTKINDHPFKPAFAKYHAILIVQVILAIASIGYVIITRMFYQTSKPSKAIQELIHVTFSGSVIAIIGLVTMIIVFLPSTDTRTIHVKGQVVDSQLRLDNMKTYVVKDKNTGILYGVNDNQKREGYVDVDISKPSHNVTHVISD